MSHEKDYLRPGLLKADPNIVCLYPAARFLLSTSRHKVPAHLHFWNTNNIKAQDAGILYA